MAAYMMPSVGPSNSCLRRHSSQKRIMPLSVSSTSGAPNVAEMNSPLLLPSSGWVMNRRPAVLMIAASSAAIPAPQAKHRTRLPRGSGSSRSSSSTRAISNGTGSRASGSAMRKGTALCRALAKLCSRSIPRTIRAHASPAAMPMTSPGRGRPGGRPSITARGSRWCRGVAMARRVLGRVPQIASLLRGRRTLAGGSRAATGATGGRPVNVRRGPGEHPGSQWTLVDFRQPGPGHREMAIDRAR
jgi:hypothetical protein